MQLLRHGGRHWYAAGRDAKYDGIAITIFVEQVRQCLTGMCSITKNRCTIVQRFGFGEIGRSAPHGLFVAPEWFGLIDRYQVEFDLVRPSGGKILQAHGLASRTPIAMRFFKYTGHRRLAEFTFSIVGKIPVA
jgi:hypothetical protein